MYCMNERKIIHLIFFLSIPSKMQFSFCSRINYRVSFCFSLFKLLKFAQLQHTMSQISTGHLSSCRNFCDSETVGILSIYRKVYRFEMGIVFAYFHQAVLWDRIPLYKDNNLHKCQMIEQLFHEYVAIHFNTSHWFWQWEWNPFEFYW